jgi:general secretion pathway protein A
MELLGHWSLRERPFEATWDTRFFYASPEHEEALNRLIYLVNETSMNLGMLSGDIGCGKTLTRSVFAERLDPQRFRVVMLENSGFPFTDLLAAILRRVEPKPGNGGETKFARCERLQQCLERMHAEGQHLVLLFDEAQDMPPNTLHELRWLTNFNGGGRTVLTLVLIGQPELRSLVAGNAAINQRISLRFHLKPLRREDVEPYVRHRLRMAGHPTGEVFSAEAADVLYEATRAVPREMNRMAKLALEHAWLREAASVEAESVKSVMRDLIKHQALPVT